MADDWDDPMIYETPAVRPFGDCYLAVEFGDEANLLLSFRVLALAELLESEAIPGVIELQPTMRQLGIVLDRTKTSYAQLREIVGQLLPTLQQVESRHRATFASPFGTTIHGPPRSRASTACRRALPAVI